MIHRPFHLLYGILLAGLAIYLYSIETSLWLVGAAAFIGFGNFGLAFEKPKSKKSDTAVRDTPGTQKYKTTIPKFTALKKLMNAEMKLDEIKKRYVTIARFYNNYKFNLYKDISNYKLAEKQMNDIVNVVDTNLNEIVEEIGGSFLDFPMLISGMVHFKYVTKKRAIEVNNDLKDMHHKGELLDFDNRLMNALESILGIFSQKRKFIKSFK